MKTEGQVKQKVKQVIFRHRKEYVRHGLAKRPQNCAHNRRISLPVHMANRASIGICGDDSIPLTCVCDSTMGGDRQAEECAYFTKRLAAEALKEEFNQKLGLDGSFVEIGYIAKEYPDVAALMWAMGPVKNVNRDEPTPPETQGNILAFFGNVEESEESEDVPERPLVDEKGGVGGDTKPA